eukprot:CAMPEP_0178986392 /NCGR_PEP_ID=MMETSP0795-20121207/2679_1 /TAXON_ID=88552 /ORGANISM="Amoebophrya sp., Strain Ameob2" /LENGTH=38 /DNA_ID= /DNA_START= /DNA_END= /DNA_ORIENTATION=
MPVSSAVVRPSDTPTRPRAPRVSFLFTFSFTAQKKWLR